MKINILSKHVADLIAAGEVVERPASAVKELIENSIDSGADSIVIEIQGGGSLMMRITDNGCGIENTEIEKAFLSHATSKIKTQNDLENIGTLGFRGEALASIAAVSKTEIMTRTKDNELGCVARYEGSLCTMKEEAGCPLGTTIVVRDLFYNVPARQKFLKKDVSEGNAVSGVVDRAALSHPEISFKFIREGKEVLITTGDNNLSNCIFSVFGKDFKDGLIEGRYDYDEIKISGYISKPLSARANRAMQYFFLNGRLVKNQMLSAALDSAYKNSIMTGRFPACVLNITIPFDEVDVNVHPSKTEVRFSNDKKMFDAVYYFAKTVLSTEDKKTEYEFKSPVKVYPNRTHEEKPEQTAIKNYSSILESIKNITEDITKDSTKDIPKDIPKEVQKEAPEIKPVSENPIDDDIVLIGQAFDTYVFVQQGEKIFVIDKHAAHERMIFNELKKCRDSSFSQILLAPITVTLSKEEYSVLIENTSLLKDAGYNIEDFGPGTVSVREIPAVLSDEDIRLLITEIAGYLLTNHDLMPEKLDWIYHSTACRAAIKGGNYTSDYELLRFAKELINDEDIRYCPHGRPVLIEIKRNELEKQFGRIV